MTRLTPDLLVELVRELFARGSLADGDAIKELCQQRAINLGEGNRGRAFSLFEDADRAEARGHGPLIKVKRGDNRTAPVAWFPAEQTEAVRTYAQTHGWRVLTWLGRRWSWDAA